MTQPISDAQLEAIKTLHAQGFTRKQIVESTGLSLATIGRYLKAAGVTKQPSPQISEVEAEFITYFKSRGRTHKGIARRLGISRTAVQRHLNAAAGKPRRSVSPARKEKSMGLPKSQRTIQTQALVNRLILVSDIQVFHQSYGWVRAIPSKDTQRLLQSLGLLMQGEVSGKRDYGKRILHGTDMRSGRFGDKYFTFIDPDVIHGRNSKGTTATLSSSGSNPAA